MTKDTKTKSKLIERIVWGVMLLSFVFGVFTLGFYVREWTLPDTVKELDYILELIEENYVGEFDRDEFISSAVSGTLDRYSTYYTADEYEQVMLSRDGLASGKIGISFQGESNKIVAVAGNSSAERAGIVEGGYVTGIKLKADGELTVISSYGEFNSKYNEAVKDEPFTLRVKYGEAEELYEVKREDYVESYVWYQDANGAYNTALENGRWVMRERQIPLKSHIKDGYAYIKLSSFNGAAAMQMRAALDKMKDNGIDKVVLDLRNNGGGYMDILTDIAGYFIPGKDKQLVTYVEYKSGKNYGYNTEKNYYANYNFSGITVLANSGTASASEALIGAILDYDKKEEKNVASVIVSDSGEVATTYGKGIMQTTFAYSGGSAIKLTTAKIFWPVTGRCIHGVGIGVGTDERVHTVKTLPDVDAELEFAFM